MKPKKHLHRVVWVLLCCIMLEFEILYISI
nr:MAG TPA: hypothetical protein [Caudoviricetes sp.]